MTPSQSAVVVNIISCENLKYLSKQSGPATMLLHADSATQSQLKRICNKSLFATVFFYYYFCFY
jgi:hypothetical protein